MIDQCAPSTSSAYQQTYVRIKKKLNGNNPILLKADKGESLAIITREIYNQKMSNLLANMGAIHLPVFDLTKHYESIRTIIISHHN